MIRKSEQLSVRAQIFLLFLLFSSASLCVSAPLREPPSQFPLTFEDTQGRQVNLAQAPQRIVSLNPGNTEILLALNAQSILVGVDQFSGRTGEAQKITQVGTLLNPSYERIVALQPELVLITDMSAHRRKQLESLGLKVAMIDPDSLEELYQAVLLLGTISRRDEAAAQLKGDLKARADKVIERAKTFDQRPRVFIEVWPDPLQTAGPGTFMHDLVELAGGSNIASDAISDWPLFNLELVVERNPAVIFTPYEQSRQELLSGRRSQWASISAVRHGRVHMIDQDTLSRPGPRLIDAFELIARLIDESR